MSESRRDEAIRRIKIALRRRSGRDWSVTSGRGTASGWITIAAPPRRRVGYGYTSDADREALVQLLGLSNVGPQGVDIPAGHDFYQEYIDRAEGGKPRVYGERYWDNPLGKAPAWVHDMWRLTKPELLALHGKNLGLPLLTAEESLTVSPSDVEGKEYETDPRTGQLDVRPAKRPYVDRYVEMFKQGKVPPPVEGWGPREGIDEPYRIFEGHRRTLAARRAGVKAIPGRFMYTDPTGMAYSYLSVVDRAYRDGKFHEAVRRSEMTPERAHQILWDARVLDALTRSTDPTLYEAARRTLPPVDPKSYEQLRLFNPCPTCCNPIRLRQGAKTVECHRCGSLLGVR